MKKFLKQRRMTIWQIVQMYQVTVINQHKDNNKKLKLLIDTCRYDIIDHLIPSTPGKN